MKRTLLAPAKINLCLHVLHKRPDGYHEVAMLMQRVSLYDRIELELTAEPGVRVVCPGVELPAGGENIAARAARSLLELSGTEQGVTIAIDKQIPVAAGLGGGSSDAAAVLLGLNGMLGLGLDLRTLMAVGAGLGADVPFFVFERPAWATGIGERLEPVAGLPPAWYVLVNPGIAVSTAWVYQNLELTSPQRMDRLPKFPATTRGLAGLLHNDLEQVTVARYPVIADIKRRLVAAGALGALMSGSGPTVFGLFADETSARAACASLAVEPQWRALVVGPV
jgi:4-diphosphocytidyl-2-C-methyl-D-erythritol kinase